MARKPRANAKTATATKLGRKPPPPNETRHDRFVRIGTKRVQNAIRQIQLLGNLCSPNYECDAHDLALMRDTIISELDMAIARFSPRKRATAETFTFAPAKSVRSPSLASAE